MSEHRLHAPLHDTAPGSRIVVAGEEALHAARVKRSEVNDLVTILDGSGRSAEARVADIRKNPRTREWELELVLERLTVHPRVSPGVEVWSAVPKGGRLDDMIDQLSQVGATRWEPLRTHRAAAEASGHKLSRLERIVRESAKQCGRAWPLELGPGGEISGAAATPALLIIAEAGAPALQLPVPLPAVLRVLIGPEGGWTGDERRAAQRAGAIPASFGPHTMRIETAAVAAAAIVRALTLPPPGQRSPG